MFINIHTHHPTGSTGTIEIENRYFGQKSDDIGPENLRSVGLHPWYLNKASLADAVIWLNEQAIQPGVMAIGEAGLDKTTDTPMELQAFAFQKCIAAAQKMQLPLLIHCVRAYEEVLQQLKSAFKGSETVPVIFHGFNRGPEVAQMLLRAGCYLSFGSALSAERSLAGKSLKITPPDRFFLETDVSDTSIDAVYDLAATLRGEDRGVLVQQMQENFEKVFRRIEGK